MHLQGKLDYEFNPPLMEAYFEGVLCQKAITYLRRYKYVGHKMMAVGGVRTNYFISRIFKYLIQTVLHPKT